MQKLFAQYLLKWYILLPVLSLATFIGCQDVSEKKPERKFTGEEIFLGVFFLQGDVPSHLESLMADHEKIKTVGKSHPEMEEFRLDFAKELMKSIKELDPDFFSTFEKQINSDNYYSIQLALGNGSKMLKAAGYHSKYSGMFRLMDEIELKKVDLSSDQFKNLDLSKKDDAIKFKGLMKSVYGIDLDDDEYQVACTVAAGFCVAYAVAGAVSVAAVAYTTFGGVQAALLFAYYVYNKVEFWGGITADKSIGGGDLLVQQLAALNN